MTKEFHSMRPFRIIVPLLLLATALSARAEESWLGLYLQGRKIGWSGTVTKPTTLNGRELTLSEGEMVMRAEMLGSRIDIKVLSKSWTDRDGKLVRMTYESESAGRTTKVEAEFSDDKIVATSESAGAVTTRTLDVPKDGLIIDDPVTRLMDGSIPPGTAQVFYSLDPTTMTLIRTVATVKGTAKTTLRGAEIEGTLVEMVDPRMVTKVFLTPKGDLIKVESLLGIEMIPEPKATATDLNEGSAPGAPLTLDLASASRIPINADIDNPRQLAGMSLVIEGVDLARLPSGDHQTIVKQDAGWKVDVHPVQLEKAGTVDIARAAAAAREWVNPGMYVPSDSETFRNLAKEVIGDAKTPVEAGRRARKWVHERMKPNAGIGVLRDASEVLASREGVCRDYAILMATLLRAAGVPTRVASGLTLWDNHFYYHAWVEVFDGSKWIAFDATEPVDQVSAGHVKLAVGAVEDAFVFTILDGAKVRVLDFRNR